MSASTSAEARHEAGEAPEGLRVRWGWVWLAWLAVALVFSGQNVVGALAAGVEVDWGWAVFHELLYWAVWAALTPIILEWARRHRLGGRAGWRPWGAHLALAAVIAPVHIALAYLLHGGTLVALGALVLSALPGWLMERRAAFLVIALTGLWKYAIVVGAYYAFDYYRRWRREREQASALALRAARLEGRLAQARLSALRSQLRPHFLFNTLNSIAVLVREAPEEAEETIRRLGALLRHTLEREDAEEVPLEEELDFLARYLAIERTRYEQRLRVETEVEPEAQRLPVPFLILQPLVENAVRHAVDGGPGGVRIVVRARREGDRLLLEVEDRPLVPHGPDAGAPGSENAGSDSASDPAARPRAGGTPGAGSGRRSGGAGTGLANLRERLRQLYGDTHRFEAGPRPDGGFAVRIRIPARAGVPAPAADEA